MSVSRARVIAATKGALRGRGKLRSAVLKQPRASMGDKRERELKARLKRARTATVKPKGRLPNPTYTGTNHFVSKSAAIRYYRDYGYDAEAVAQKIKDGEIRIGKPSKRAGQHLELTDSGKRYVIVENPGFFGSEAVARAKRVTKIRRVRERDTNETGEIVGVQPGGFIKVQWDNRQRPTLIKRSEIKRYPYLRNPVSRTKSCVHCGRSVPIARVVSVCNRCIAKSKRGAKNPGIMDLAGSVQAIEYLADKAGPGKRRRRNSLTNPSVAPYTLQTDAGQRVAGEWWTKAVALKVAQQYANDNDRLFWIYKTNKAGSTLPVKRVFPKKKKRNPSVAAMSRTFQGNANGQVQEFYASDYAPRLDFSRGGKFIFLKLAGTTIRLPGAVVAIDPRTSKLWIAGSDKRAMFKRKAAKKGELLDYGAVDAICYLTSKKHIENGKTFEYVHKFGEEGGRKPKLMIDHDGMPILKGGDYKIESRGIIN